MIVCWTSPARSRRDGVGGTGAPCCGLTSQMLMPEVMTEILVLLMAEILHQFIGR